MTLFYNNKNPLRVSGDISVFISFLSEFATVVSI